jgi:membrane protease YdiL (CAAX protease family)
MTVAPAPAPRLGEDGLGALRLARLLIRFRLRFLWNGMRVRGRGRVPVLAVVVGLFTSLAYVLLFAQAFSIIRDTVDVSGQITALAVVALTISFGSFTAKAASSEAVLAGSPENEFLLARPVALPRLVVARCLAESATDPLGALFLLPVLLAATIIWRLPWAAIGLAVLVSLFVQLGISALSQATQIAVVRFVPRARRRAAWMTLGLLASLSLASLWMMGTRVLRAPAALAQGLSPYAHLVARSPGALIVGPLAALVRGSVLGALGALLTLAAATSAAVLLAATVARRAGMSGWEEAGAAWADAAGRPGTAVPRGRVLTAATKDLALITRDRTRLLTLISMPIIFVGVQLFGAAGWDWSTATLERVSHLSFSLTLYMVTIGPLAHMQAERRAFWIMRTVPLSVGRLLAGKAKAWSVVIGAVALASFSVLSLGTPDVHAAAWFEWAAIVVGGAVGMSWLAIALAAGAADLSDEQRPAIGPTTIYVFMLIGGLYNVVLAGDAAARVRGIVLYAFAIAGQWAAGVHQANVCLDAEAARARRLTLGDGAAFVIAFALGQRGVAAAVPLTGLDPVVATLIAKLGMAVLVGLVVVLYLARRRSTLVPRLGLAASGAVGVAAGLVAGAVATRLAPGTGAAPALPSPGWWSIGLLVVVAEELLFRGVVQRGLEEALASAWPGAPSVAVLALAGTATLVVSVVAVGSSSMAPPLGILLAIHGAAVLTRATTGRVSAAVLARVAASAAVVLLPLAR